MNRFVKSCAFVLPLTALTAGPLQADVKTRDKGQVKFEGVLGRMMGMFGGKAAKDGVVTSNAVRGDRKAEFNDTRGRIVDLKEEKVYEIDMKKKTYEVTTFDELRRRMREAQEKAQREAPTEQEGRDPKDERPAKEMEVDFDVKETGQTKTLAGYDTRQVIMTVTVREKGRTLDDGGGLVMTADSWIGPEIPAMKELAEFEMRYWKALAPETAGMSAEQMAAAVAMFPMIKSAMERLQKESVKLEGTPLATTTTFEAVKSKEQMAEQPQSSGGGGLGGMLARRLAKRDDKPRSTIVTINHETLEVATNVADTDLAIPAGFKAKD